MPTSLNWITDSIAGVAPIASPDLPALALDDAVPLTYRELRAAELRYAAALSDAGIGRGDRVAILMHNCTDYVVAMLAISRVGAISVRPNWRLTAAELDFILADAGIRGLMFDTRFTETVDAIRGDLDGDVVYVARETGDPVPPWASALADFGSDTAGTPDRTFPELGPDDPYTVMYTSGTTGNPKGAVLTHGNAMWIGAIQIMKWHFESDEVALNSGPLFHAGAFEVLLLPALLAHGTAITLSSGGFSLERFLEVARAQSVTSVLAYSFALYDLVRLDDLSAAAPKSLRRIVTGGDVIMPWVYDELESRLPDVRLVQSYSLTEGGVVGTMLDHDVARGRERSVGRPNPMTEVKIVGFDGEPASAGDVGEIYLRSPGVAVRYWNRPAASAATFVDGWCRTGDLGAVDADGYLTLAGRAKDMIRSGGENVYPAEIEKVLTGHPDVGAAAVVGVADPKYVEVGCAILEPRAGHQIDLVQIAEYCAQRLAKYKIPKEFHAVDTLPRNASGKIRKNVLREEYAGVAAPAE